MLDYSLTELEGNSWPSRERHDVRRTGLQWCSGQPHHTHLHTCVDLLRKIIESLRCMWKCSRYRLHSSRMRASADANHVPEWVRDQSIAFEVENVG